MPSSLKYISCLAPDISALAMGKVQSEVEKQHMERVVAITRLELRLCASEPRKRNGGQLHL